MNEAEQSDLDTFINQVLCEQNIGDGTDANQAQEPQHQQQQQVQRQNFMQFTDMAQPYFDSILPLQGQQQGAGNQYMPDAYQKGGNMNQQTQGFEGGRFMQGQNQQWPYQQPSQPQGAGGGGGGQLGYSGLGTQGLDTSAPLDQGARAQPERPSGQYGGGVGATGGRQGGRNSGQRNMQKNSSDETNGTHSTNEYQGNNEKFVFSSINAREGGEDYLEGEEEPPSKHPKLNKQEAMLEKNRKAQRKFREKQKEKMQSLEVQVMQLRDELKALSVENTDLQSQRTLLQQALRFKDCLVQSLREQEGTQFKETKIMEVYGVDQLNSNEMTDSFGKLITIERLKLLQQVEINEVYKRWIKIFRELLETKGIQQKKGQQYSSLLKEIQNLGAFLSRLSIHNYSGIVRLLMYNVETMELINKTEDISQQEVKDYMGILNLSSKQEDELHTLYWKMHERKREKVQLLQTVTAQVNQEFQQLRQMHPINYIRQQVSFKALKFHDAANRFKTLVEDVHLLHTEFYGMILYRIFEPMQTARILVKAYPEFPNLSALVHYVYNQIEQDNSSKQKKAST